ncbi:EscU/YscU/HrcU family type III secretion system export apparatus switch protein [Dermatophilus congolensis]|uniref:EscU/YscU/HrcU family type III secretion system export apparatus switch protein n=1 Tax=Dermatophilus congolensis TaxID=1863 RepID=UPI001AAEB8B9|nr:EscU/YscU/HrcU family type III secretion system export apparatus switch protein [Dermatophilus congolensis]MBO3143380.1 EscU/YscU/HrcU family type III secretion system export apparatus switch protein [Dermatophilus congolensis]MBO3152369.1 EscU/YscU/HrcU family type III secretion system export apparatus switch protein [Dermatophilus congolensis]MBO3160620.1 EscU/YscU/HrcU family type III secretion system export apparatus switch protein [Dermatophilus congolensis]MBO3163657.1 EscU/YscU/HrcU f
MAEDKSSKTEKATPEQLRKAKAEGNIPRTQDLSMWLTVLAFYVLGPTALSTLFRTVTTTLHDIARIIIRPDPRQALELFANNLVAYVRIAGPIILLCMVLGSVGHLVQGGTRPNAKRFKPKWKKLNAFTGIKNLFGMQAAWTFAKTMIKFVVFGVIAYMGVKDTISMLTGTGQRSITTVLEVTGNAAYRVMLWIIVVGLVIAALDYGVERHRVEKSLRMSKDEIKRENKQQEGDPHIKGQRRARQREMGQRRMMAAVSESTVVLTNPVHVAVALRYISGEGAPQVVAKGAGLLAQRIKDEAAASGVPVVQDVILARTLFKMCEVDSYIPFELYDTIATVLAFIMRMSDIRRTEGAHPSPVKHPGWNGVDLPEDLSDEALGIAKFGAPEGASYSNTSTY